MTYVALFRGINVGGKNIVKMAELRRMLSELRFQNVKTYIQSGNAIFNSDDTPDIVKKSIQTAFQNTFKFESAIVLQTKDDICAVINLLPFSEDDIKTAVAANSEVEHLYFYFIDDTFSDSVINALNSSYGGPDRLSAGPGGVYLLCHESVRDSKLAAALSKQNAAMTARNWKTLNKLFEMM